MQNYRNLVVGDINSVSFNGGINWAYNGFMMIKTKQFWLMVLLTIGANMLALLMPVAFLGSLISLFCTAIICAFFFNTTIFQGATFSDALNRVTSNILDLTFLWVFTLLLRFIFMAIGGVMLIIACYEYWPYIQQLLQPIWHYLQNLTPPNMNVMMEQMQVEVTRLLSSPDVIKAMIRICFMSTTYFLVTECIIYMFTFFTVPLVLYTDTKPCQAMWLSFKAVNKNIMSFIGYGLTYLILAGLVMGSIVILNMLLGIITMFILNITLAISLMLVLGVMHTYIQFYACNDVFFQSNLYKFLNQNTTTP